MVSDILIPLRTFKQFVRTFYMNSASQKHIKARKKKPSMMSFKKHGTCGYAHMPPVLKAEIVRFFNQKKHPHKQNWFSSVIKAIQYG